MTNISPPQYCRPFSSPPTRYRRCSPGSLSCSDVNFRFTTTSPGFDSAGAPIQCSSTVTTNCFHNNIFHATSPIAPDPPPPPPLTQDCPAGQYRVHSGCIAIPDCNSNTTTGGNFFQVSSGQCVSSSGPVTLCIGKQNDILRKWCPPLNDCVLSTQICSDNSADLLAAQQNNQIITPQKKTESQQAATAAQSAATSAMTIKASSDTDVQTKTNQFTASQAQHAANPSPENITTMATALSGMQSAQQANGRITTASSASSLSASNSSSASNSITTSTPAGMSTLKADEAAFWRDQAIRAMQAASRGTTFVVNNFPTPGVAGDGRDGVGEQPSANDADGDTMADGIDKNDVDDGSSPQFGHAPTIAQSNQRFSDALSNYGGFGDLREAASRTLPTAACPSLTLDTGQSWFGALTTDAHCTIVANYKSFIENVAKLSWLLGALMLFMTA